MSARGRIALIVRAPERPDRIFFAPMGATGIGGGADDALRVDHPSVHPRHARLRLAPSRAGGVVADLEDDRGGVRVQGAPVSRISLAPGDRVALGEATLIYLGPVRPGDRFEGRLIDAIPTADAPTPSPLDPTISMAGRSTMRTAQLDGLSEDSVASLRSDLRPLGGGLRPLGGAAPLLVVSAPDRPDRRFELARSEALIGRGDEADLQLADASVSRFHARITCARGRVVLEDLGSRNRTLLNDRPAATAPLRTGDVVALGRFSLTFHGPEVDGPARSALVSLPAIPPRARSRDRRLLLDLATDLPRRLGEDPLTFGRAGADVAVAGVWLGPIAAEISWDGQAHALRRRAFGAAVRLNGRRVSEAALRSGDLVEVGGGRFRYVVG